MTGSDWIALASSIVALCALGVSIWQGYVTRQHSVLSVAPHLDIFAHASDSSECFIELRNGGLGPAFLDSVEVSTLSKSITVASKTDWRRVFAELWVGLPNCNTGYLSLDAGTLLAPNASTRLVGLSSIENQVALGVAFRARILQSTIKVTYHSMYGNVSSVCFDGQRSGA